MDLQNSVVVQFENNWLSMLERKSMKFVYLSYYGKESKTTQRH
jgi:hypothetical protein